MVVQIQDRKEIWNRYQIVRKAFKLVLVRDIVITVRFQSKRVKLHQITSNYKINYIKKPLVILLHLKKK